MASESALRQQSKDAERLVNINEDPVRRSAEERMEQRSEEAGEIKTESMDRNFEMSNISATRNELEVKSNINDIQKLCMDMEGEKSVRCFSTAQKFDDEMTEALRDDQ